MDFHPIEAIKAHPYLSGGVVVGAVVIYLVVRSSGGGGGSSSGVVQGPSDAEIGAGLALQQTQLQDQAQLQAMTADANAKAAHDAVMLQAQQQQLNYQSGADTIAATTASHIAELQNVVPLAQSAAGEHVSTLQIQSQTNIAMAQIGLEQASLTAQINQGKIDDLTKLIKNTKAGPYRKSLKADLAGLLAA